MFGEEVSGFHFGSYSLVVTPKEVVSVLDGTRLKALLTFASAAASITCTRRGAELPYRHNVALG